MSTPIVNSTPARRKYDSARRRAQADQTRRQILEAARKLFIERGYAGATIEGIAGEAGVAPETIYAIFKNKKRILLKLMDVATLHGSPEGTAIPLQAGPQAVSREPDQRRQLQIFARVVATNLDQAAPISEVMDDAARSQPDVDRILQRLKQQRLEHMRFFVQQLAPNGPFQEGVDEASATDTVWTLTSPEVYLLLTRERGWSKEQFALWLADALSHMLLPPTR